MRAHRWAAAAAFASACSPAPAAAQAACAAHAVVVERLADGYGETRQSIALGASNAVVEVFASHETGTWTITVTRPGGPTCIVASGIAYEALREAPAVGEPT